MATRAPRDAATHDAAQPSASVLRTRRQAALLAVLLFVGVGAVGGGIGLIVTNGLKMPLEWLDGTPFSSYTIPGIILALVVGGSHLGAAWLVWTSHPRAVLASLAAGLVLLGWISTQVALIGYQTWLQPAYAGLALLTIWLAWRFRQGSQRLHHPSAHRESSTVTPLPRSPSEP